MGDQWSQSKHNNLNMNTKHSWIRLGYLLPIVLGCFVLCQCEKKRTVLSQRSTGYKFSGHNDHELESNKGKNKGRERMDSGMQNKKLIKNRKGEVIDEVERSDLYAGRSNYSMKKGKDGKILMQQGSNNSSGNTAFKGTKKSKFANKDFQHKEFRTPEYLKKQEFAGNKTFRNANDTARESGNRLTKKLFNTQTTNSSDTTARESSSRSLFNNKTFSTKADSSATKAQSNAANPTGVKPSPFAYERAVMSVDEVKKLVNPTATR